MGTEPPVVDQLDRRGHSVVQNDCCAKLWGKRSGYSLEKDLLGREGDVDASQGTGG